MQKLDDFQTENFDLIAGRRAFARSSRATSPPTPLQGAVTDFQISTRFALWHDHQGHRMILYHLHPSGLSAEHLRTWFDRAAVNRVPTVRCRQKSPLATLSKFLHRSLPMAKERAQRNRITFEVDPETQREIERWAISEGRPISNLMRRVVSELVDQRSAARARGAAARGPIQKQLSA